MNLSLFRPQKDQCGLCVAYETGNVSEVWNGHVERKDTAIKEKAEDKGEAVRCLEEGHTGENVHRENNGHAGGAIAKA